MPFEVRIALRYLTARRKQAFISLISAIAVLGVSLGVMALLIALGLMTGLQGEIRSRILGATAHISLFKTHSDGFDDYREVMEALRRVPRVRGVAPAVYAKALLASSAGSDVATVKGLDPRADGAVTDLAAHVQPGARLAELVAPVEGPPPILLGRDLANKLGVAVGDVVTLTSPQGRLSPMGVLPRVAKLRVLGTVRNGLYEFDAAWAYVPLETAQRLFGDGDKVSLIELRIDDMYAVDEIARSVKAELGPGYDTTDWIQMNGSLFQALWLEKTVIGIVIFLIVMVAALNIVATLVLMVMEKHKDIAILVSMGASRGAVARVFMLQGTIIGGVGTLIGGGLGWAVCHVFDRYRLIQIPGDVYQISHLPFTLQAWDAALVLGGAMLTCFVATLHPARGAARLDPAEALRYE
jgi:lipoprotein-releasing system permease protein